MSDENKELGSPYEVGKRIERGEFLEMAREYRNNRQNNPTAPSGGKKDSRSCYFSRDILETILQTDCTGIRIYYGMRPGGITGQKFTNVVLVGVKKNPTSGKETIVVVNDPPSAVEGSGEAFYDWGQLCPPDGDCEGITLIGEIDEA